MYVLYFVTVDFCVKLLALRPTQFIIYWLEPETNSDVSYYQVSILRPAIFIMAMYVIVALTGLPIGYSVIVALTGLPIGYSVIVALTGPLPCKIL